MKLDGIKCELGLKSGKVFKVIFAKDREFSAASFTASVLHTIILSSGKKLFVQGDSIEYVRVL